MNWNALAMSAILAAAVIAPASAQDIDGHWQGTMTSQGAGVAVSFDFTADAQGLQGRFTSPTQAAMDYPLDKADATATHVAFTLGGSIAFDGALAGDRLSGTFKNGDQTGTFDLRRSPPAALGYDTQDVSFRNGDVTLKGTLCLPRTPGRHPAVVLLHGSGPQSRWGTTRYIADRLARAGIVALIYDKRGSGDSGGDWRTASYADLARDALAGAKLLAARSDVDGAHIGLLGHSQGGAIAPLAAALAPDKIAFIVAEDTFAGPQSDQDVYRVQNALAELNLSPADFKTAMTTYTLFVDAARGARPYADFEKQSAPYRQTAWYKWMEFPPRDSWLWPWAKLNGSFDSLTVWRQVHVPVLLIYGEKDALVPVGKSIAAIGGVLAGAQTPYAAFIVPGAQHNLTIQPEANGPFFWWHQAPGVIDTVVAWVKQASANRE